MKIPIWVVLSKYFHKPKDEKRLFDLGTGLPEKVIKFADVLKMLDEGVVREGTVCNTFEDGTVKSPKHYLIRADNYLRMQKELEKITK